MRLLIITQKIDEHDPILGFMCGWLRKFASVFDELTVICLEKGAAKLPPNVRVYSLGKERAAAGRRGRPPGFLAKLRYANRFLRYIAVFRQDYDAVFVHMNPEYVILGGLFWRLWRKKIVLWYNHGAGGLRFHFAIRLASVVCHTSPYAASARFSKSRMMPVGVDTELFKPTGSAAPRDAAPRRLLYLGRVAPIKKIEVMLEAATRLLDSGENARLAIVGDALPRDTAYFQALQKRANESLFADKITFRKGEGDRMKVATIFAEHEFFLNGSPAGLFDKTVFEAMACGCIPLVSSEAFAGILPEECFFKAGDSGSLASRLTAFFRRSPEELERLGAVLREKVVVEHSLEALVKRLKSLFEAEIS